MNTKNRKQNGRDQLSPISQYNNINVVLKATTIVEKTMKTIKCQHGILTQRQRNLTVEMISVHTDGEAGK